MNFRIYSTEVCIQPEVLINISVIYSSNVPKTLGYDDC